MNEIQEKRDELQENWTSETGLNCEIYPCRFSSSRYHLCGYVEIPADHPLFGVDYSDTVPASLAKAKDDVLQQPIGKRGVIDVFCMSADPAGMRAGILFDVHGGITYSRKHKDGTFWYGFDCGHCDDNPITQDSAYVRRECESLARQLVGFAKIKA